MESHKYVCYYCKERIETKDLIEWESEKGYKYRSHKKCRNEFLTKEQKKEDERIKKQKEKINKKQQKDIIKRNDKKMREERKQKNIEAWKKETQDLDKVYRYLQDILNFNKPLSPKIVRQIQNLRAGKMVRKGTEIYLNKNGYPYEVILLTLKAKRQDIDRALKVKLVSSDLENKVKYILAIIKNTIPDIYLRWENRKNQLNKINEIIDNNVTEINKEDDSIEYIPSEKKNDKELNNLW